MQPSEQARGLVGTPVEAGEGQLMGRGRQGLSGDGKLHRAPGAETNARQDTNCVMSVSMSMLAAPRV